MAFIEIFHSHGFDSVDVEKAKAEMELPQLMSSTKCGATDE
jgi:hypothetical protein